ncbi:hypothetical protein [Amycolatopsis keratiniphila]|uniref:hypothetical protein n=1 Tax=Amycolatopsis keratiniphila TaxID=129921 RepID=UPI00087DE4E5|nr:hypothetical protein [Amycolatopsis keratiniphila]OLZ59577.1 hypothetical protein BS330_04080 [Amycolatopsis keratiniphila subsp. nogabecina]SDU54007.1 hypothetical protein SAMN04489733_5726 [Amycolatopsis keratiniphila]
MNDDLRPTDPSSYRQPAPTDKDWSGTAAADYNLNVGTRDLYATAGLDRKQWTILGIDVNSYYGHSDISVYALDRGLFGVDDHEALKKLTESNDSVPVTRFHIPWESGIDAFVDEHFKSFNVYLTTNSMVGMKLQVTGEKEIKELPDAE